MHATREQPEMAACPVGIAPDGRTSPLCYSLLSHSVLACAREREERLRQTRSERVLPRRERAAAGAPRQQHPPSPWCSCCCWGRTREGKQTMTTAKEREQVATEQSTSRDVAVVVAAAAETDSTFQQRTTSLPLLSFSLAATTSRSTQGQ
ncbi:hypothetical protein L596_013928 [Steinernema carpocapsae]|uniref:Uncharacterized protein n=1 Tax=Steinernema carpocapsae TaxID=34508 RepID=A0A4U5P1L5_STECR|nr:hypothetical protein L596_013928 [Steinernema carpocapsae]